jgi:hypothetical protein
MLPGFCVRSGYACKHLGSSGQARDPRLQRVISPRLTGQPEEKKGYHDRLLVIGVPAERRGLIGGTSSGVRSNRQNQTGMWQRLDSVSGGL